MPEAACNIKCERTNTTSNDGYAFYRIYFFTGSSVKYFDPDTLQENFKAIDKHREDEDRAIISDWVNLNGPEYCRKQIEEIWTHGA